jgi:hypothetical protein
MLDVVLDVELHALGDALPRAQVVALIVSQPATA